MDRISGGRGINCHLSRIRLIRDAMRFDLKIFFGKIAKWTKWMWMWNGAWNAFKVRQKYQHRAWIFLYLSEHCVFVFVFDFRFVFLFIWNVRERTHRHQDTNTTHTHVRTHLVCFSLVTFVISSMRLDIVQLNI